MISSWMQTGTVSCPSSRHLGLSTAGHEWPLCMCLPTRGHPCISIYSLHALLGLFFLPISYFPSQLSGAIAIASAVLRYVAASTGPALDTAGTWPFEIYASGQTQLHRAMSTL